MQDELITRLETLDAGHKSAAIATVSPEGGPHATRTFFRLDTGSTPPGLHISVLAHSHKLKNMRQTPQAGFSIGGDVPALWANGHGRTRVLAGAKADAVQRALIDKSPEVRMFTDRLETVMVALEIVDVTVTDIRGDGEPVVLKYDSKDG